MACAPVTAPMMAICLTAFACIALIAGCAAINPKGMAAAVADYRIAELEFQRDTGLLKVDEKGLWQEYRPKGTEYEK